MSKRLVAMLVSVTALAAAGVGCGSSDEESLTKAEFIKRGDTICKKVGTEPQRQYLVASTKYYEAGSPPGPAEQTQLAERYLIPSREAQLERLRELPAPSDEEERVSAMLDTVEQGLAEAEEDPASIFLLKDSPLTKANEELAGYGFKVCGTL